MWWVSKEKGIKELNLKVLYLAGGRGTAGVSSLCPFINSSSVISSSSSSAKVNYDLSTYINWHMEINVVYSEICNI